MCNLIIIMLLTFLCNNSLYTQNSLITFEKTDNSVLKGSILNLTIGEDSYYYSKSNPTGQIFELVKVDKNFNHVWSTPFGFINNDEFDYNYPLAIKEIKESVHVVMKSNPYTPLSTSGHVKKGILNSITGEKLFDFVNRENPDNFKNIHSNVYIEENGEFFISNFQSLGSDNSSLLQFKFDNKGENIIYELIKSIDNDKTVWQVFQDNNEKQLFIFKTTKEEKVSFEVVYNNFNYSLSTPNNYLFVESKLIDNEIFLIFNESILPYYSNNLITYKFDLTLNLLNSKIVEIPFTFKARSVLEYKNELVILGNSKIFNSKDDEDYDFAIINLDSDLKLKNHFKWSYSVNDYLYDGLIDNNLLVLNGKTDLENDSHLYNCKINLDDFVSSLSTIEELKEIKFKEIMTYQANKEINLYNLKGELIYSGSINNMLKNIDNYKSIKTILRIDDISYKLIF